MSLTVSCLERSLTVLRYLSSCFGYLNYICYLHLLTICSCVILFMCWHIHVRSYQILLWLHLCTEFGNNKKNTWTGYYATSMNILILMHIYKNVCLVLCVVLLPLYTDKNDLDNMFNKKCIITERHHASTSASVGLHAGHVVYSRAKSRNATPRV